MTNVKSFKINDIDASIALATDTEDGLMSSESHNTLGDISAGVVMNRYSSDEEILYPNDITTISDISEFIEVKIDNEGKLLESMDSSGNKIFYTSVTVNGELNGPTIEVFDDIVNDTSAVFSIQTFETDDNTEWIDVTIDSSGRIIEGIKTDGTKYIGKLEESSVSAMQDDISELYSLVKTSSTELPVNYNTKSSIGHIHYQKPTAEINHCIIYGQSLSTGQQTCPAVSQENYRGNLMIGQYEWTYGVGSNTKDAFYELYARPTNSSANNYVPTSKSDQTNGETPNIGFVNSNKHMLDDHLFGLVDRKFLASSAGTGGKSIELLSKDVPHNSIFSQFTQTVDLAKSLSDAASKSIVCPSIIWMQGEYNSIQQENQGWFSGTKSTNDKDAYKAMLIGGVASLKENDSSTDTIDVSMNGLVNDMISYVKEIYEQEDSPIVLIAQQGANYVRSFENPIDQAFVEAQNECEELTVVSSSYRVTDRGGHLDANGSRWLGELFSKVWYKRVILGQDWKPLQPNKIEKGDNYLLISFDVPEPPLVFDTEQVRSVSNYGFEVHDGGTAKTISSVQIKNNTQVLITCSSSFAGDVEVAYASYGKTYGNLRDSDPWKSLYTYVDLDTLVPNKSSDISYRPSFEPVDEDGNVIYDKPYPCQNFCLKFYYKISQDSSVLSIDTK